MLNHQVFIKYKSETPSKHVELFCEKMLALRETIDEIEFIEIGLDEFHEDRSWDVVIIMKFQSVEKLRNYQKHSDHVAVMQFNAAYVNDVGAIDFHETLT